MIGKRVEYKKQNAPGSLPGRGAFAGKGRLIAAVFVYL